MLKEHTINFNSSVPKTIPVGPKVHLCLLKPIMGDLSSSSKNEMYVCEQLLTELFAYVQDIKMK